MGDEYPLNSYDAENEIREALLKIGLSAREVEIFICICNIGPQPGSIIAKNLDMKRTTVYHCLQRLTEKGFVYVDRGAPVSCFHLNPIKEVAKRFDEQKDSLDSQKNNLIKVSLILNQNPKPASITTMFYRDYRGLPDLKRLKMSTVSKKKEICIFASPGDDGHVLGINDPGFWRRFEGRINKEQTQVRVIIPDNHHSEGFRKNFDSPFIAIKTVPLCQFPVSENIEITILDSSIVVIGPQFGAKIEGKELADLQRATFELAWAGAESLANHPEPKRFFL